MIFWAKNVFVTVANAPKVTRLCIELSNGIILYSSHTEFLLRHLELITMLYKSSSIGLIFDDWLICLAKETFIFPRILSGSFDRTYLRRKLI